MFAKLSCKLKFASEKLMFHHHICCSDLATTVPPINTCHATLNFTIYTFVKVSSVTQRLRSINITQASQQTERNKYWPNVSQERNKYWVNMS